MKGRIGEGVKYLSYVRPEQNKRYWRQAIAREWERMVEPRKHGSAAEKGIPRTEGAGGKKTEWGKSRMMTSRVTFADMTSHWPRRESKKLAQENSVGPGSGQPTEGKKKAGA